MKEDGRESKEFRELGQSWNCEESIKRRRFRMQVDKDREEKLAVEFKLGLNVELRQKQLS